jgi:molybdenum cofactor biosynthesis protein B
VITVSDTRSLADDTGGALVCELLEAGGHRVALRELVKDDAGAIRAALERMLASADCAAVVLTGGTGIAPRDVTPEAVAPVLERELPGFGELFRQLSFAEIGSAALLSRAFGGLARGKPIFALPGSRAAVRLALERLILPELGHLASEASKTQL